MIAPRIQNRKRQSPAAGLNWILTALTLLPVCESARGQEPSTSGVEQKESLRAPDSERPEAETNVAIQVLSQHVALVDWEEKPFSQIIKWLRKQGPVNVVPVWRVLKKAEILPTTQCTLTLREVSVAEVI